MLNEFYSALAFNNFSFFPNFYQIYFDYNYSYAIDFQDLSKNYILNAGSAISLIASISIIIIFLKLISFAAFK